MFFLSLHNHHHHYSSPCRELSSLSALKTRHQRQLNDVRDQFDIEQTRIDNREVSNAQEIENLHRKCICLTKL